MHLHKECKKLMNKTIIKTTTDAISEDANGKEYGIYYHNDNVTTFEFVILSLVTVFSMSPEMATSLAMNIHQNGRGLVGIYSMDEAYEKVDLVDSLKKEFGAGLVITIEEI